MPPLKEGFRTTLGAINKYYNNLVIKGRFHTNTIYNIKIRCPTSMWKIDCSSMMSCSESRRMSKVRNVQLSSNNLLQEGFHHLVPQVGEGKEPHDGLLLARNIIFLLFQDVICVFSSSSADHGHPLAFLSFLLSMAISPHHHFCINLLHLVLQTHSMFIDAIKDAGKCPSRQQLLTPCGNKSSQLPSGGATIAQESSNHLLCHL